MSKHLSNTERLRILEEYLGDFSSTYAIQRNMAYHQVVFASGFVNLGYQTNPKFNPLCSPTANKRARSKKKLRSQVVQRLSEPERLQPVAGLCELLGFSRQAYYKRRLHALDKQNEAVLETSIILDYMYLRLPEHLPQGGCRELYLLCQEHFEDRFTIGRDRF